MSKETKTPNVSDMIKNFAYGVHTGEETGLAVILATIDHWVEHGDYRPMAYLLTILEGKSGKRIKRKLSDKTRYFPMTKRIMSACLHGIVMKADENEDTGKNVTVADNAGVTEKLSVLRQLVADEVRFFSPKVREAFPPKKKDKTLEEKRAAAAKSLGRKLVKEGWDIDEVIRTLREAASEEQRKAAA